MRSVSFVSSFTSLVLVAFATPSFAVQVDGYDYDDQLQLRYTFNEGANGAVGNSGTTATDHTGWGYDASVSSGIDWVIGKWGAAVELDANTETISVSAADSDGLNTDHLSVTAWIKPESSGVNKNYVVHKYDATNCEGFYIKYLPDVEKIAAGLCVENNEFLMVESSGTGTGLVELSEWTHVAFTFDGDQLELFVNGVSVDTDNTSAAGKTMEASDETFFVGSKSVTASANDYFEGVLDEVRIYGRGLHDDEVLALNNAIGGEPGLIFYEPFDQGATLDANGHVDAGGSPSHENGYFEKGYDIQGAESVKFPASGNLDMAEGTVSFWIKPSWDGDDTDSHRLFTTMPYTTNTPNLQVTKYYNSNPTVLTNSLQINYDGDGTTTTKSRVNVSTTLEEPEATENRITAGEWHFVEIFWDSTPADAPNRYVAYAIDGVFAEYTTGSNVFPFGTSDPTDFYLGRAPGIAFWDFEAMIDELKIYDQSMIDYRDPVSDFVKRQRGDGVRQAHETPQNSPVDAAVPSHVASFSDDVVFFESAPFEAVYEGTVPELADAVTSINYDVPKDNYETLYFNVFSRVDLSDANIDVGDFTKGGDTISDVEVFAVHNWWQAGTIGPNRVFMPVYVPELLLEDGDFDFNQQAWAWDDLPDFNYPTCTNACAIADIAENNSKQFAVRVHIPDTQTAGVYSSTVTLTSGSVTETLTLNLDVLDFALDSAEADGRKFLIYQRQVTEVGECRNGSLPECQDLVDQDRYEQQLADIAKHGFGGVTLYNSTESSTKAGDLIDDVFDAGLTDQIVFFPLKSDGDNYSQELRDAYVAKYSSTPWFYGDDEPTTAAEIENQIDYNVTAHSTALSGWSVTAFFKYAADCLRDEDNTSVPCNISLPTPWEDTDVENISNDRASGTETSSRDYYFGRIDGTVTKDSAFQTYYWQSLAEDPRVNRFYSGYGLFLSELDGIFPYAYNDYKDAVDPYNDFDEDIDDEYRFRDHIMVYPSEYDAVSGKGGPVPTVQWEATREGIDDYRLMLTWQNLHDEMDALGTTAATDAASDSYDAVWDKLEGVGEAYDSFASNDGRSLAALSTIPIGAYTDVRGEVESQILVLQDGLADNDSDGVKNINDNCKDIANPNQTDNDSNDIGNVCDTGDTISFTVKSEGSYDGYIREDATNPGNGWLVWASQTGGMAARLGDHDNDDQLVAMLSFEYGSSLPSGATVTQAELKLTQGPPSTYTGDYSNLGTAQIDLAEGNFGSSVDLQASDFEAAPDLSNVGSLSLFDSVPTLNIWTSSLSSSARSSIESNSRVQLKIKFTTATDSDTTSDWLAFFSGSHSTYPERQPALTIYHTRAD